MSPRSNKAKGAQFEIDLMKWFRGRGYRAERLHLNGRDDEGDIAIHFPEEDEVDVIEAKNVASIDLASFIKQITIEAANYIRNRPHHTSESVSGYVVIKRRGKPIGDSYVVTTLSALYPDYTAEGKNV